MYRLKKGIAAAAAMTLVGAIIAASAALALGGADSSSRAASAQAVAVNCTGTTDVTCTFGYTGSQQEFTVPAGVSSLHVAATGGTGGAGDTASGPYGAPGQGVQVSGNLAVTPGATLYIYVGGNGTAATTAAGAAGGWNGGGNGGGGGYGFSGGGGGGGGGASDIRIGGTTLADRKVVAAGGGGGGGSGDVYLPDGAAGGFGGLSQGFAGGGTASAGGGGGGTQVTGGAGGTTYTLGSCGNIGYSNPALCAGGLGVGGNADSGYEGGGGGGAGRYGGGGGGATFGSPTGGGGGGGGSSYVDLLTSRSAVSDTTATPQIVISYTAAAPVNHAPTADSQSVTALEGTAKTITLTGGDEDGNALTFAIVNGPSHGSLGTIGTPSCSGSPSSCSAVVQYTPNGGYSGEDSFTFKVNDGTTDSAASGTVSLVVDSARAHCEALGGAFTPGTGSKLWTCTVTTQSWPYSLSEDCTADGGSMQLNNLTDYICYAANRAPTATGQSVTTDANTARTITLAGSDPDGTSVSFEIVDGPSHGTLGALGDPSCSGSPYSCTADVQYTPTSGYSGDDSFTFKTNDGAADSATATVSITVSPSACTAGSENFSGYDPWAPQATTFSGGTIDSTYGSQGGIQDTHAGIVLWSGLGVKSFQLTFTNAVASVQIDAGSAMSLNSSTVTLTGYDASHNVVDTDTATQSAGDNSRHTLAVNSTSDSIKYFTIATTDQGGIAFTNIVWTCAGGAVNAPTITFSDVAFSDDTGSSGDFITNTTTQTISGTLSDTPATGDIVYGSLDNGTNWTDITSKVSGKSLSWTGASLVAGSNTLLLKVSNSGGDGPVFSQQYVLDTTDPVVSVTDVNGNGVDFPYLTKGAVTSVGGACTTGDGDVTVTIGYASSFAIAGGGSAYRGLVDSRAFAPTTATCSSNKWTYDWPSAYDAGSFIVSASQTDAAENTGDSQVASISIDTSVPTVESVTTSTADGLYKAGDTISIQVAFSEPVDVTGTPQLMLETGATDRTADYTSGAGSDTLTFTYTVQSGDTTADLDYTSTTALTGTIADGAGNAATLTLPELGTGSLAANATIAIDAVDPIVTLTNVNGYARTFPYLTNSTIASVGGACTTGDGDVSVTVDGNATAPAAATCTAGAWTLTLSSAITTDGSHVFAASQTDLAGNTGSESKGLTIDTTAPTVKIDAKPPLLAGNGSTVNTFAVSGTDTGGSGVDYYACKLDADSFAACTSAKSYSGLANGSHTFSVKSVDKATNESTVSSYTWRVDGNVAGSATATFPASASTKSGETDATYVEAISTGGGDVTVAEYMVQPAGTGTTLLAVGGVYYDVQVTGTVTAVTITLASADNTVAYWHDGSAWVKADPQSYNAGTGTITIGPLNNATTSPKISQLTGTVFGMGKVKTTTDPDGPDSVVYGGPATLTADVSAPAYPSSLTGCVEFKIGTTSYGSDCSPTGTTSKTFTKAVTLGEPPGTYVITAIFTPDDPSYKGSQGTYGLTVVPADAEPTAEGGAFIGQEFYWVPANSTNATVTLGATIENGAGTVGDIRTATVGFSQRSTTGTLTPISGAQNLPVGLVDPADTTVGTAAKTLQLALKGTDVCTVWTVAVTVGGNYTMATPAYWDTHVSICKPTPATVIANGVEFANAGGAGPLYDAASFSALDFDIAYTKKGSNPKGKVMVSFDSNRNYAGVVDGSTHTYWIRSTAISTFSLNTNTTPNTAAFSSKATVQELVCNGTCSLVSRDGGAILQVSVTDTPDQVAVTVNKSKGGLWFSSQWDGKKTTLKNISSGEIAVS